jgi:hypothetical protein
MYIIWWWFISKAATNNLENLWVLCKTVFNTTFNLNKPNNVYLILYICDREEKLYQLNILLNFIYFTRISYPHVEMDFS